MKPRVLMVAYACDPEGTGEHWLGWGWAEQAAQSFTVELITTPKARAAVEDQARALGITPHFVAVSATLRKLTELAGGGWLRKLAWQKRALNLAAELHAARPFALVHQTTFHTFRVPFLTAGLGIPSVWGPIAGGERIPPGFQRYLGGERASEATREWVNRFWLRAASVQRSLAQASVIFVSNHTTLGFLPAFCRGKCQIVAPNTLRAEDERYQPPPGAPAPGKAAVFNLIYAGNCVARRGIPLALEALSAAKLANYEFNIVGSGPALPDWKRRTAELGLEDKVRFRGQLPHAQLKDLYRSADVLVFPALRDSGGSALLEAMARYLPVLCLDWGGPGEMVDEQSGIKIPVTSPEHTVPALGAALRRLQQDPALRTILAGAARKRAEARFRWQAKRELLEATYRSLLRL
jgi:glycosyltransferase involved in cell wall biosynthesis